MVLQGFGKGLQGFGKVLEGFGRVLEGFGGVLEGFGRFWQAFGTFLKKIIRICAQKDPVNAQKPTNVSQKGWRLFRTLHEKGPRGWVRGGVTEYNGVKET